MIEVCDLKRCLRCLIRAVDVQIIRFGDMPEAVWRGERFASAREFQEIHVRCLPQYAVNDDFEFVTLHFELIEVIEP
ncbi:hypothetical protein [Massilia timonae]|nr:hypothetical protein [Massilia timonae]